MAANAGFTLLDSFLATIATNGVTTKRETVKITFIEKKIIKTVMNIIKN
jgi:hypothetical protein